MTKGSRKPLLNPILNLKEIPRQTAATTGGKKKTDIKDERLNTQRMRLAASVSGIRKTTTARSIHSGKIILEAKMYEDSLSPSFTPDAIFDEKKCGTRLLSTFDDGYLIESDFSRLGDLENNLARPGTIFQKVDVSRVQALKTFNAAAIYTDSILKEMWHSAVSATTHKKHFKAFSLWLLPYLTASAKREIGNAFLQTLKSLGTWNIGDFPSDIGKEKNQNCWIPSGYHSDKEDRLRSVLKAYVSGANPRIQIGITRLSELNVILASGTVYRIDPVAPLTSTAPGIGSEPGPPSPAIGDVPVVGVVDGGADSKKYALAEAWRPAKVFVPDHMADKQHGNQVISLVVDASGWNNKLELPKIHCRFAPVQVVPKKSAILVFSYDEQQLLNYLENVIASHGDTKIWNLSFNQEMACRVDRMSFLGHGISRIARKHNILPVISAGNRNGKSSTKIAPPADCEAALVVSGRQKNFLGRVGEACSISRCGTGPEGILKPDMSWFSELRVLGGATVKGTSYATPLVAVLAAHTWQNLKAPNPDLVRALLINYSDLISEYDPRRGWGSPVLSKEPWFCPPGVATIIWTSRIKSGFEYVWDNINIPPP